MNCNNTVNNVKDIFFFAYFTRFPYKSLPTSSSRFCYTQTQVFRMRTPKNLTCKVLITARGIERYVFMHIPYISYGYIINTGHLYQCTLSPPLPRREELFNFQTRSDIRRPLNYHYNTFALSYTEYRVILIYTVTEGKFLNRHRHGLHVHLYVQQ